MYKNLGIIAAAGKATRFGGVLKELLPCGESLSFLSRNAGILRNYCDRIITITNEYKISEHAIALGDRSLYAIQRGDDDIKSAILTGLEIEAQNYYFVMADTYIPRFGFADRVGGDFVMGCFETDSPARFGVLRGDKVVNKEPGAPGRAWGVLCFSHRVRCYWLAYQIIYIDYTNMINAAMRRFQYKTFPIAYYYDMASFGEYKRFISAIDSIKE